MPGPTRSAASTGATRPRRPRRGAGPPPGAGASLAGLAGLAGLVALAGCSTGPVPSTEPDAVGGVEAGPDAEPLHTMVRMGRVTGRVPRSAQRRVKQEVGEVVDRWFDAAYVAGDYPRGRFPEAFDVFTPGAARRAVADRALMSNAVVGPRTTAVEAVRREVRLDVLGVAGRPAAVTVRFVLATDRTRRDAVVRRERFAGRLLLTRAGGGRWKVFAYDVGRGSRGPASRVAEEGVR